MSAKARAGPSAAGTAAAAAKPVRLRPGVIAAALAAMHVSLALLALDPTPHPGGDNAAYLALADALLRRHAYVDLWDPLTPPHTQYPPAFPLLLAGMKLLGFHSWVAFKLLIVAFSGAAIAFTYLWLRRWISPRAALAISLVVGAAPGVIDLAHWVLSDVPFWALVTVALWAWSETESGSRRFGVAVGATLLAYFIRSAGLPLVAAALAWLALRRQWRRLGITAAVVGVPAAAWWLRARSLSGIDYVQQFRYVNPYAPAEGTIGPGDLLQRGLENAGSYAAQHLPMLLFGLRTPPLSALCSALLAAALVGWAMRLRRPGVPELFLPLYGALLLAWPAVWSGERFLLPALPPILGYAALALAAAARRILGAPSRAAAAAGESAAAPPRRRRVMNGLAVAGTAALILVGLPQTVALIRVGMDCSALGTAGSSYPCAEPRFASFFRLAEWSRGALPPGAAVISRKPTLFYHFSGHPSRIYPKTAEPDSLLAMARVTHSRYVVFDALDALSATYLGPILTSHPNAFCVVRIAPDGETALFGIEPDAARIVRLESAETGAEPSFARCPASYAPGGKGGT